MAKTLFLLPFLVSLLAPLNVVASEIYLNQSNITVEVGAGTSVGSFRNTFSGGGTIGKVIDAPSADAEEFHNQTTHVWFTASEAGGGLELLFDFGIAYDISTLHFWNYSGETYDVDNVDFTFFDINDQQVGAFSIQPDLGTSPGILAQDIELAAPLNIKSVQAFLTGSNREIDFQNIGFTAEVSQGIAGDFNFDGDVDGSDFLAWQRGSSPAPLSNSDLADWTANYGQPESGLAAVSSTQVPEPMSIMLVLLGSICLTGDRRQR